MQSKKTTLPTPTTTIPQTLTPAQARALLHTLLSTPPSTNSPRLPAGRTTTPPARQNPANAISPPKPTKALRPSQPQQHNITIDASTHIMGHCNNLQLLSVSPTEQAAKIEEMLRGALAATANGTGEKKANVDITVHAGVNVMGSKNFVTFGGNVAKKVEMKDAGASKAAMVRENDAQAAGRKRRAQSEPADTNGSVGKKVKVET